MTYCISSSESLRVTNYLTLRIHLEEVTKTEAEIATHAVDLLMAMMPLTVWKSLGVEANEQDDGQTIISVTLYKGDHGQDISNMGRTS